MNQITFPLTKRTRSTGVDDLQHALKWLLGEKFFDLPGNDWRILQDRVQAERVRLSYGLSTQQVVAMFQAQNELAVTGEVDQPTALRLNATLEELGAFLTPEPNPQRLVSGHVRRSDNIPRTGGRVRAFHQASQGAVRLGEDTTDADGGYTIRYELLPATTGINLYVLVTDDQDQYLTSSKVFGDAKILETIDLSIPGFVSKPVIRRVLEGRIMLPHGAPAEGLRLRLYRQDFGRPKTLISETVTIAGGTYSFPYEVSGQAAVSLEVVAVNASGAETPLSRTIHGLGGEATTLVNLVAPQELQPLASEYQRLTVALTPHIGNMSLLVNARENKDRQDLTALHGSTGWDARLIALAANAATLSADPEIDLPQEVLYGLFRAGLPSDKLQLAQLSAETLEQALTNIRTAGIVNLSDAQILDAKTKFQTFAVTTTLESPTPGSLSTYGQMLNSSRLSNEVLTNFAQVYLNHRGGDADALWQQATEAGISSHQIQVLQQQGKLAFLTLNNHELTARLQHGREITDPVQLVGHDFYRADTWVTEVRALAANLAQPLAQLIPPAYEGETVEERLSIYAEDMARKVRISYPTQVIGRMVEQDTANAFNLGPARTSTATFLDQAAGEGFRLGQTPVDLFVKDHPQVFTGLDANQRVTAVENARALHRVYQITPSNESMSALMTMQLTSAYDVVGVPKSVFLERTASVLSSEEANLIYSKARQVSSVTSNIFALAKTLDTLPFVYGLSASAEVKETAKADLIRKFPTMESLFGSMDFCECEHCRSVLSPAAYLVDLLQFIDAEPALWDNFLMDWSNKHPGQDYITAFKKPYDAFIERRPDIPHIPLTCENTHTALPYIDVVNEILEYYVANERLDPEAAHDTGEATTAELLAEPQNVIASAYEKLRQSRYPLTLPFDLWLETVRKFSDYCETPLWQLLETLRSGDALFGQQPYDRAAIFIESLGLSPNEYTIFTNPAALDPAALDPAALDPWYKLYGYSSAAGATTVSTDAASGQRIDLNSAKTLSRRLGVTYKELLEIVKTGFVNPKLAEFGILNKLSVEIQDVFFYKLHKDFYDLNKNLLGKDRSTLSTTDQQRYDILTNAHWARLAEIQAFETRLVELGEKFEASGFDALAWLNDALDEDLFEGVLLLVNPDAGCNFDLTTLQYASGLAADPIAFLKINLFVRLWRKLGWTIEETDRALQAFIPRNTPFDADRINQQPLKTALIYLAHLKRLDEQVSVGKQSRLKLLTLWSQIATTGKNPLYAQLFLGRSVLKNDPVFDDKLGNYLSAEGLNAMAQSRKFEVSRQGVAQTNSINPALFTGHPEISFQYDSGLGVQHLSYQGVLTSSSKAALQGLSTSTLLASMLTEVQEKAAEFSRVNGHLLALQGALGMTADEIARALTDDGQNLSSAVLSLDNVSLLYRYRLMALALNLSVRELISLKQLSGLDPFKSLSANPLTSLAEDFPFIKTMRFVEIAGQVKDSGLKIEDLEYVLRHRFDETGKYRLNSDATLSLMKTLAEGIGAIRREHSVPSDPGAMSEDTLRQKLGLVLTPDVVQRLLAMMNGTIEFTATQKGVLEGSQLQPAGFADEPSIAQISYNRALQEQKITFRGVLFDPQETDLMGRLPKPTGSNPHVPSPLLGNLLNQVQTQARAFFDKHLQKQTPNVQPATGFLEAADFELLFAPIPTLLDETQRQARLRQQRTGLAQAFLPFLQKRLIRQFTIQTLTAQTGAEPALVESLVTDARLLRYASPAGASQPLLAAFTATGERGLTASFFASVSASGTALSTSTFADADTASRDQSGQLKPAGANSARFTGYLEAPTPGAYRFYVNFGKQGTKAELRFDHLPQTFLSVAATADGTEVSEYLDLKAGVPYRFTMDLKNLNGGDVRLLVQGESLPKQSLAQLKLYPGADIENANHALFLLRKVLYLSQALNLSEREVRYLLTHAGDFANLDLSKLPTRTGNDTSAGSRALFEQFLRLAGYARLKRDLAEGTDDLISIFEAGPVEQAYTQIAKVMRREKGNIKATAKTLFYAPSFKNELTLQRLWEALQVVERFGVPVTSLVGWTRIVSSTPDQRFAIAREVKGAVKARFEPETWQRVAQPIFDKLRQRQRDALAAYVMHQHGFARMEQLYEYFLIDPGMEPVVQTSRIRLAISSLQLFIHRTLLNLEKQVHPSALNSKQWEWMKRYRVWEANRKIFLFPENWLEPEFRDDKTHLFSELEGSLLAGDVSNDLVEDAFLKYLRKLEELARLDILAMHLADNSDPTLNVLHVIGRTYSTPHKYFYRRYAQQMWTAWEPITTEIEGDHLAPVVWRDRLYLFWVTFMDKPDKGTSLSTATSGRKVGDFTLSEVMSDLKAAGGTKKVDVQLHWSEYLEGEWSPKESGGFVPAVCGVEVSTVPLDFDYKTVFIHVSKEKGEERGVFINLGSKAISQSFYLAGRNSVPETADYSLKPSNPYSTGDVLATRYSGSGPLTVTYSRRITIEDGVRKEDPQPTAILSEERTHTLLPCDNDITRGSAEIASLVKPFFYQDNAHTLFVEPAFTETTVETWRDWLIPLTAAIRDLQLLDVISGVPTLPVSVDIGQPAGPAIIAPGSILGVNRQQDWLLNAGTGLLFNGEVIGPSGLAGVAVLSSADVTKALGEGGVVLNTAAGSAVATASAVIATDIGALERSGLTLGVSGLNVVGTSGLNQGLLENFRRSFGSEAIS